MRRTVDFDPEKHKGMKLYELKVVRRGSVTASVAVTSDVGFEQAALTPWHYVVMVEDVPGRSRR